MKFRIALTALFLLLLAASALYAEPQKRVLSGIDVTVGDSFTAVKIKLDNNAYQELGRLSTQKYVIDAILENTDLKDGRPINLSPKGSKLVNSISAASAGVSRVRLRLHFKEILKNINEGLKVEQGADGINIRLDQAAILAAVADRKAGRPTASERKAAEDKKKGVTQTAKNEVAPDKEPAAEPHNVAGDEKSGNVGDAANPSAADAGEVAGNADGSAPDGDAVNDEEMQKAAKGILDELHKNEQGGDPLDFDEKKDKTLLNLFGVTTAKNDPNLAPVPDGDYEAEKEGDDSQLAGVGTHLPDLTSLYWMAGGVFLLAALWFLYRKFSSGSRVLPNLNLDKPMKVLSTQKIDDNQNLMMVEIDKRRFLISSNGSDTRLLAQLNNRQPEDSDLSKLVPDMTKSVPAIMPETKMAQKAVLKVEASGDKAKRADGERPSFFGGKSLRPEAEADSRQSAGSDGDIPEGQAIPGMAQRLRNLRKRLD